MNISDFTHLKNLLDKMDGGDAMMHPIEKVRDAYHNKSLAA